MGSEQLIRESVLKDIIKVTVTDICNRGNKKFPTLCLYAKRSQPDKNKIIRRTFDLMTGQGSPMELDEALAFVDESLAFD
jgi:hypothetical protein